MLLRKRDLAAVVDPNGLVSSVRQVGAAVVVDLAAGAHAHAGLKDGAMLLWPAGYDTPLAGVVVDLFLRGMKAGVQGTGIGIFWGICHGIDGSGFVAHGRSWDSGDTESIIRERDDDGGVSVASSGLTTTAINVCMHQHTQVMVPHSTDPAGHHAYYQNTGWAFPSGSESFTASSAFGVEASGPVFFVLGFYSPGTLADPVSLGASVRAHAVPAPCRSYALAQQHSRVPRARRGGWRRMTTAAVVLDPNEILTSGPAPGATPGSIRLVVADGATAQTGILAGATLAQPLRDPDGRLVTHPHLVLHHVVVRTKPDQGIAVLVGLAGNAALAEVSGIGLSYDEPTVVAKDADGASLTKSAVDVSDEAVLTAGLTIESGKRLTSERRERVWATGIAGSDGLEIASDTLVVSAFRAQTDTHAILSIVPTGPVVGDVPIEVEVQTYAVPAPQRWAYVDHERGRGILWIGDSKSAQFADYPSGFRYQVIDSLGIAGEYRLVGDLNEQSANPTTPERCTWNRHSAVGGDTTEDVVARLGATLAGTATPEIVCIDLGANGTLTPEQFGSNMQAIVDGCRGAWPDARILVAIPIPVSGDAEREARLVSYTPIIEALVGVEVVDLRTGFDSATLTSDGIHQNDAGNVEVAARWIEAIGG